MELSTLKDILDLDDNQMFFSKSNSTILLPELIVNEFPAYKLNGIKESEDLIYGKPTKYKDRLVLNGRHLRPISTDLCGVLISLAKLKPNGIGVFLLSNPLTNSIHWKQFEIDMNEQGVKITSVLFPKKSCKSNFLKRNQSIVTFKKTNTDEISIGEFDSSNLNSSLEYDIQKNYIFQRTRNTYNSLIELKNEEDFIPYLKAVNNVGTVLFSSLAEILRLRSGDNDKCDFYLPSMRGVASKILYTDISDRKNPERFFYGVKVDRNKADPNYLIGLLESEFGKKQISYGVTHSIPKEKYMSLKIPKLSVQEQQNISLCALTIEASITELQEQHRQLFLSTEDIKTR